MAKKTAPLTPPHLKVLVDAYRNKIVIVPVAPRVGVGDRWWPTGGGRFGSVVGDTKHRLGMSAEALRLLSRIQRRSHDALADVDWWACTDGTWAFSWIGSIHRILDPERLTAGRRWAVSPAYWDHCTKIPNAVPAAARRVLDADPTATSWAEPFEIPPYDWLRHTARSRLSATDLAAYATRYVKTYEVLADAYVFGRDEKQTMRSHALIEGDEKALCGLQASSLCTNTSDVAAEKPTCPTCLRRDGRWAVERASARIE